MAKILFATVKFMERVRRDRFIAYVAATAQCSLLLDSWLCFNFKGDISQFIYLYIGVNKQ